MKKYLALLIGLLVQISASACSFIPFSFCETLDKSAGGLVVFGEIIGVDSSGIDFKIIEVLRGEESTEIIRIWDGTDFDCNGIWSMAAADIGELNDSMVLILPKITETINDWDVIGDYRRPGPYSATPELHVENGIVKGFISGLAQAPVHINLWRFEYEIFKERIIADMDCSSIVSTKEVSISSDVSINNPFSDYLRIQLDAALEEGSVQLFSLNGELLFREEFQDQLQVEVATADLVSGIYILQIETRNSISAVRKVLKY